MPSRIAMAPSILSADFTRLADAVASVVSAGAEYIHVDVMDGHFVPNLTIGPPVIRSLKAVTTVPLDVHLMVDNAEDTLQWYIDAGADIITVHAEACRHLHRAIQTIQAGGVKAGVALNPATPATVLSEVIQDLDLVLVMSVNPGFGGQTFLPVVLKKIQRIADMIFAAGSSTLIEVDGGIDPVTAPLASGAGAQILVAGNAVFGQTDPADALGAIRSAAQCALI